MHKELVQNRKEYMATKNNQIAESAGDNAVPSAVGGRKPMDQNHHSVNIIGTHTGQDPKAMSSGGAGGGLGKM